MTSLSLVSSRGINTAETSTGKSCYKSGNAYEHPSKLSVIRPVDSENSDSDIQNSEFRRFFPSPVPITEGTQFRKEFYSEKGTPGPFVVLTFH